MPVAEKTTDTQTEFKLEFVKTMGRNSGRDVLRSQLTQIQNRILAGNRSKHWSVRIDEYFHELNNYGPPYTIKAVFNLTPLRESDKNEQQFKAIRGLAVKASNSQRWDLLHADGEMPDRDEEGNQQEEYCEIELVDNWKETYFSHIYERDAQINIVKSAIDAGATSNFTNRFHCVLHGSPACAKTEIARTFRDMLGDDAVLEYDATSTTAAGAIKDLNDRAIMPRLLIIEEIEKADETSLRWLLGLLDHRAEIRKTNFKVQIQKNIKLLCIATVNDYDLFKKMMYGALASRFAHHIFCPRPTEEILRKILEREIDLVAGDTAWIEPAIKFAKQHKITDPRKVTAFCLCGQDRLLDGSYQAELLECMQISVEEQ